MTDDTPAEEEATPPSEDAGPADQPLPVTPSEAMPISTIDPLASPGLLAGHPGDHPDLLDRVATAIGDLFEDHFETVEDPGDRA